jgi:nucleoside-diphosphate-sugar epimerase
MQKQKLLICGVSGFIGGHLAEKFIQRDDLEVYGVYCKTQPRPSLLNNSKIKLIKADLTDKSQIEKVVAGMDLIVQAAAVTTGVKDTITRPYVHVTDNAVMNALLYRAAFEHKVKHLVFFSCTTMYSPGPTPLREEDFNHQIIPKYHGVAWTKVYNEKMCEFYSRLGGTKFTAIRHSNIYGPYDKFDLDRSHVFGATVNKVMNNTDGVLSVWGDGSEGRDLIYVSDLVDFVELVLAKQTANFELVNLGCGKNVIIRDLVQKLIDAAGKKIKIEYDLTKPTMNFNIVLNCDKAEKQFGWSQKVSLDEGIKKTLAWYHKTFPSGGPR